MPNPTYTPEQIAIHLDEARFMLREPIKSFIALDDSARTSIAIIEQQRAEIERLHQEKITWRDTFEEALLGALGEDCSGEEHVSGIRCDNCHNFVDDVIEQSEHMLKNDKETPR